METINEILHGRLMDAEQIILQKLYGDLHTVQAVAEELSLTEAQIIKISNSIWLRLDITTKQQLLEFWKLPLKTLDMYHD